MRINDEHHSRESAGRILVKHIRKVRGSVPILKGSLVDVYY